MWYNLLIIICLGSSLLMYSKGANGKCNSLFKFVVDFMKERAGQSSTVQQLPLRMLTLVQLPNCHCTRLVFKLPHSFKSGEWLMTLRRWLEAGRLKVMKTWNHHSLGWPLVAYHCILYKVICYYLSHHLLQKNRRWKNTAAAARSWERATILVWESSQILLSSESLIIITFWRCTRIRIDVIAMAIFLQRLGCNITITTSLLLVIIMARMVPNSWEGKNKRVQYLRPYCKRQARRPR